MIEEFKDKEFTFKEIISWSWFLLKDNLLAILILVFIFGVPADIIRSIFTPLNSASLGNSYRFDFFRNILSLVTSLLTILSTMAVAFFIEQIVLGQCVRYQVAVKRAVSRWMQGIKTDIVTYLIVSIGLVLLVVPGIYLATIYLFGIVVAMLRGRSSMSALDYSADLVKGKWFKVFGVLLLAVTSQLAPYLLVNILLSSVLTESMRDLVMGLMANLISSYTFVVITVAFLNLDYRKNGVSQKQHRLTTAKTAPAAPPT